MNDWSGRLCLLTPFIQITDMRRPEDIKPRITVNVYNAAGEEGVSGAGLPCCGFYHSGVEHRKIYNTWVIFFFFSTTGLPRRPEPVVNLLCSIFTGR